MCNRKVAARWSLLVGLLVLGAAAGFAEGDFEYEPRFAAPTYGAAIMPLNIRLDGSQDGGFTMLLPGVDMRVAAGNNVSQGGGFWSGYEAGAMFFFQPAAVNFEFPAIGEVGFSDTYSGNDGADYSVGYDVETSIDINYVYLLAKYGYRLDIGFKYLGVGVGAEVGLGGRLVDGRIRMETSGVGGDDNYGQVEWLPTNPFGIMVDGALEATLRVGPNFVTVR